MATFSPGLTVGLAETLAGLCHGFIAPSTNPTSFSFFLSQVLLPNKMFALLTPSQCPLLSEPHSTLKKGTYLDDKLYAHP